MPRSFTPRKFIALILAASLAVTGLSAAPAQAGDKDVARALAAIAGLAIIGAAIHENNKKKRRNAPFVSSRGHDSYGYQQPRYQRHHKKAQRHHRQQRRAERHHNRRAERHGYRRGQYRDQRQYHARPRYGY